MQHFLTYHCYRDQYRSAPFTPFSVTLGYMIKEIHRCLLLLLASESSPMVVTQILKVCSLHGYCNDLQMLFRSSVLIMFIGSSVLLMFIGSSVLLKVVRSSVC